MAKRRKLSAKTSKRIYKQGLQVPKRNLLIKTQMRGGTRL